MESGPLVTQHIKDPRERLVSRIAACMLREPNYYAKAEEKIAQILADMNEVATIDPEFICQLAYYTRNELNIRSASNFLLAFAANHPEAKKYLKQYFSATIKLPTDLIETIELCQSFREMEVENKTIVPACLQDLVAEKFKTFSIYHLGKYCSEGKRKRNLLKVRAKKAANDKKQEGEGTTEKAASKKGTLSFKQLVRLCHIKEPSKNVMSILGKRYPENSDVFATSGLVVDGEFNPSLANKRMKIPTPVTWETQLSASGNKAEVWEELIRSKKLPFMAMLRNIRNLLITGVDPQVHEIVQDRLKDPDQIQNSKLFPFRFFSAYEAIKIDLEELQKLKDDPSYEPVQPAPRRGQKLKYKRKKIIPKIVPTQETIESYYRALEEAVKLATALNIKPVKGNSVIFADVSGSMKCPISGEGGMGSVRTCMDIGILLGLMMRHVCENSEFVIFSSPSNDGKCWKKIDLKGDNILELMNEVKQEASTLGGGTDFPFDYICTAIENRAHFDNMFIFSDMMISPGSGNMNNTISGQEWTVEGILRNYRENVNANMKFISINLGGHGKAVTADLEDDMKNILVSGYSDSILRLVTELQVSQVDAVKLAAQSLIKT
ncbi:unnamed protein product [Blepharisma stoltei]|uniref:TROVE domain-containing protein n=1 Tax=Blepharisma stoltei TaxID=1481888 RepID=A0AAU9J5L4_9CILI|nr:unnamed protein product [Blepharisma stoltei]